MFIGHFAVGLAAKRVSPKTSLGSLFLAAQFIDLLWPILLLIGLEEVHIEPGITQVTPLNFSNYPYSHSLLAVMGWGILVGAFYFCRRPDVRASVVLGLLVISHWFLDVIVHRPDLPLTPFTEFKAGLGLWNSLPLTLLLELGLFSFGLWVFTTSVKFPSWHSKVNLLMLSLTLIAIWLGSLFGPPPPDVHALALVGNAQWLFVIWGYWIERQGKFHLQSE